MKFFKFLGLASLALAGPVARQQETVTGTIASALTTLENATKTNLEAIKNAVDNIRNNVNVNVTEQEVIIRANYDNIASALKNATTTIVSVTTGAAGGVWHQAQNLTQAEVDQLAAAVNKAFEILNNISVTVTVTVTDLEPAVVSTLAAELNAVKAALSPFFDPLYSFVIAAASIAASVGITVKGLNAALDGLFRIILGLLGTLGLF